MIYKTASLIGTHDLLQLFHITNTHNDFLNKFLKPTGWSLHLLLPKESPCYNMIQKSIMQEIFLSNSGYSEHKMSLGI